MWDRRKIIQISISLLLAFSLTGCSLISGHPTAKYKLTVKLYYGSPGNERLVSETRTITYNKPSDKYKATLDSLLQGPQNPQLVANINPGTKVLKITRHGKDLDVDLSREFFPFAGSIGEIVAIGSIVNTLVQFPEIERVKITVAGEDLIAPSGQPRGYMTKFENNYEPALVTRNITLYFADQDANFVHPERRQVRVAPNLSEEEFIKTILQELIAGPTSGTLFRTIPHEANIRAVVKQGNLVKVDFSAEMVTKHWGGAAGEAMTINSLTATLTDIPGIKRVLLTVEGQPLAIEHMVVDQPLTRNPNMIKP